MAPPIWSSVSCRGIFVFRAVRLTFSFQQTWSPEALARDMPALRAASVNPMTVRAEAKGSIDMTMLADLPRDFRYAARSLLRTPAFTVVAVAVLALGIGATSAIFSLVSAVWLKPLPFADEERLVSLWVDLSSVGGPARLEAPPANYVAWRERAQSFEEMAPVVPASVNLTGGGEPERLAAV